MAINKNDLKETGIPFRQKVFLIALGLFLVFMLLETGLRISGALYNLINRAPQDEGADFRIFSIGESITWGIGVSNLDENYPSQLEKMLNNKFPDLRVRCLFDQTIGQNTSEIARKIPFYIKRYNPKLVILMVGTNNWWNLDKSNVLIFSKNRFISDCALKTLIFLDQLRIWKLLKWIYYRLNKNDRWNYWFPHNITPDVLKKSIYRRYGEDIFIKIAEYDIREMVKICMVNKIKVIICSYPRSEQNELFLIQKKVANEFQLPFVDNRTFFNRLADSYDYFSQDQFHPNDKGYRLVAENIYNCILENNLIEPGR